jgi:NitT/TauT family transport system permease protein
MSAIAPSGFERTRERVHRALRDPVIWQGAAGIASFFVLWQLLKMAGLLVVLPSPIEVAAAVPRQVAQDGYWMSWVASSRRVFLGFFVASALAITLGVAMGMARKLRQAGFPILEILRPIPPLAWLPLSILFWPSPEMTMVFLTFLGAFFPVFINVLAGIDNIDVRYVQAARSLGASQATLFWRVMVPGALPSLFTGLSIAIGITWEVVIAAEMASAQLGLGYLTWNAYMSQSLVGIVVGMLSIGVAGMVSAGVMGWIGRNAMPWRRGR